ncbi:MAG TPA: hypothetical protein VIP11_26105 [Gemmatimonadaceae bacterium]
MAAATVLAACSSAADPQIIRDWPTYSTDLRSTVVATDTGLPNDPISIDSARVVGDTLAVGVNHGGGCANHTYQLVIGNAWMESFPVQVGARIAHNANGDACKALIRRDLRMSLRPLADAYRASYQQEHGSVSIRLSGTTTALLYTF